MLFDLRGRGRRRIVKVIYLGLAVLMGGGLVLFGIGGNTSGGLFDAISGNSGGSGDDTFQERVDDAQKRVEGRPADATAWAALAKARYQLAGIGDNFDQGSGTFTEKGKQKLRLADQAWQKHLALKPAKVDATLASQMVQAYSKAGLDQPGKAVDAQEIVIDSGQDGSGQYANLAVLAYAAGRTREGDLAAKRALELAESKMQREALKDAFAQAKKGELGQTATTPAG
jgi:hypothetical protein